MLHLLDGTRATLELLKGGTSCLAQTTRRAMRHFPVLESLVARRIKERADGPLVPPTNEECYGFMRQFMVFHENPDLVQRGPRRRGEPLKPATAVYDQGYQFSRFSQM